MSYNGTLLYHKFLFNRWIESKKILAQKAEQIIAISENTKKDIIDLYGIDKNKIKVIYLGNSLKTKAINISEYITLPDKYILFVGNRSGYKNFNTLIEAIIILLKNDKKLNIVCAGGGKFTSEEIKLFEQFNIQNRVHQYNVNDTILSYLYKNALVFIFSSMYEGFGIPIIEAFSSGCPVILANSSSFPEIASDAAIYFKADDKERIREITE